MPMGTSGRSLLSVAGIRWFFGSFVAMEASNVLVWIIILTIAVGAVRGSGLWRAVCMFFTSRRAKLVAQQRFALKVSLVILLLEAAVIVLLTALPHAVLLSVTGELFPSSFSVSIVPVCAFMGTTVAVFYGLLSGNLHNVYEIGQCMCAGGRWIMPLLLLYVIASSFYFSCRYTLMLF